MSLVSAESILYSYVVVGFKDFWIFYPAIFRKIAEHFFFHPIFR